MNNKPFGNINRMSACLAALLFAWVLALPALGDGKVFPAVAFPAEVKIPDQSALLIWSNGVERLVIETRFVGEGTNFAWVVPLPSVPVVEPATTGLFPTLRYALQPELRHRVTRWWGVSLFAVGLLWLLITVRRGQPRSGIDLVACLTAAGGFAAMMPHEPAAVMGGPALFLALLLVANRVRGGRERAYAFLLAVLLVLLLSAMLLPALAKGGSAATSGNGVSVLDRRLVGTFETTTITAKNADALLVWLKDNGYAVTADATPTIEQHVRNGWVFVATKVRRDTPNAAPATPHPLSFTFKTSNPVYPLRLTGTGGGELAVDLFVVGPGQAQINGFKTTECHVLAATHSDRKWRFGESYLRIIGHESLLAWAEGATVVTRLEATLQPAQMQQDAEVTWGEVHPVTSRLYSKHCAAQTAANWMVPLGSTGVLLAALLAHFGKWDRRRALGVGIVTVGTASVIGFSFYTALPKVPVRMQRWPATLSQTYLKHLGIECSHSYPTNEPVNLESVRKHVAIQLAQPSPSWTNLLLGGPIREEDSPGNYTLRDTPEGVEILGYDTAGAQRPVGLIRKPTGP